MSKDTFDMNDLRRDFARDLRISGQRANRANKFKLTREALAVLAEAFPGAYSKASALIKELKATEDPCDVFRDMDEYPMLTGFDVYVPTGVKLADLYNHPPNKERLWLYMLENIENYPGGECFIVFRPYRSKSLWVLTNRALPHKGLVPRITIPAPMSANDMTVIKLENLILDLQ